MKHETITINYCGLDLEVHYDYSPEEPMVMYYKDGSGYPGCPEDAEITEILHNKESMFELLIK